MGDESIIDGNFVKASLDLLSCHPIKFDPSADSVKAKSVYLSSLQATLDRFRLPDTKGQFQSVGSFIHSFDMAVLDQAQIQAGLQEQDVRKVVFEQELLKCP